MTRDISTRIVSQVALSLYDWPSEKKETWRHITNFDFVSDETKKFISLEAYEGSKGVKILRGDLLPPPVIGKSSEEENPLLQRYAEIEISHFSIDFGDDDEDESRGFWLADFEGAWYKLETPISDYADIANKSKEKCKKFLEFFDVVVHLELPEGGYLSAFNSNTELYTCCYSLNDLYYKCGGVFDLDFCKANADFYVEQVENQFTADSVLMNDLKQYTTPQKSTKHITPVSQANKNNGNLIKKRPRSIDSDSDSDSDNIFVDKFVWEKQKTRHQNKGPKNHHQNQKSKLNGSKEQSSAKTISSNPKSSHILISKTYDDAQAKNATLNKAFGKRNYTDPSKSITRDMAREVVSEPAKQNCGLKPDYLIKSEKAKEERQHRLLEHSANSASIPSRKINDTVAAPKSVAGGIQPLGLNNRDPRRRI